MSYKKAIFYLHITIPILLALISFFVFSNLFLESQYIEEVTETIDGEREDVLKLTASATAVSVAITALPGDLATPIAETLADLSKGFLVVLCALYLEKFLFPIVGMAVFQWLIPIVCILYIIGFLSKKRAVVLWMRKLFCFALILFLVIPAGTTISGLIRERYGEAMEQTIASAKNSAQLMEESVENGDLDKDAGNGLGQILKNLQQTGDTIARGTSEFMRYLEKLVSRFMEAIAVMLVTSCIIPILVVLCFVWLSKLIFLNEQGVSFKQIDGKRFWELIRKEEKNEETDS